MGTLTFREFRHLITLIDNGGMSVKELRDLLFDLKDQDAMIKDNLDLLCGLGGIK